MKERLQHLLSEVGESFDYLGRDVRNLSRSMAELEELMEGSRAFATKATPPRRLIGQPCASFSAKTHKVLGPPPDRQPASPGTDEQEAQRAEPFDDPRVGAVVHR